MISGDIELNPDPVHQLSSIINIGRLNVSAAANKVDSIHDIVTGHDVEEWSLC